MENATNESGLVGILYVIQLTKNVANAVAIFACISQANLLSHETLFGNRASCENLNVA